MAALSAIKNRNNQKLREGFESFLSKCLEKSEEKNEVDVNYVLQTLEDASIKIDKKELVKLQKVSNAKGKISR